MHENPWAFRPLQMADTCLRSARVTGIISSERVQK